MLVEAIRNSRYSIHDLSRAHGDGDGNFSRMNMPIEMGMAMFFALDSQRQEHRCAFFVATPSDYRRFASDVAGLDPKCHYGDAKQIVSGVYEWLRGVAPLAHFNSVPTVDVVQRYVDFCARLETVKGSDQHGKPTHDEIREVMYQMCAGEKWWDWRNVKAGQQEFPTIPLAWR
jgi:hypothetical protein